MTQFQYSDEVTLEQLNNRCKNTLSDWIGIEFIEIGADYLVAKMPVDHRTIQPLGVVNGGAFCALAETVGSMAANLCLDRTKFVALGLDINANHLKSAGKGHVYGTAKAFHVGKSTQVWEIKISDDAGNLCCISRLTMAVVAIPSNENKGK
ncbi:MAG: PaaI family thioesterase [Bacteroidia bacterium]|nr:PaaI family thioesterase [Bacteroidia bacterium]MCF8428223.1 PaaI family thioesterase [Bacteroidia bacterium]MCF8447608.1 PaaI family thioesterase [Bacteroidia bacterium]